MNDVIRGFQTRMFMRKLFYEQIEAGTITESDVLGFSSLLPERVNAGGLALTAGQYAVDGEDENGYQKVYRTSQAITLQANIDLSSIPFMTLIGYVDGVRIWVKPHGISDKYPLGAIVHHNGQNYVNTFDDGKGSGNGFEPGGFGWEVQK